MHTVCTTGYIKKRETNKQLYCFFFFGVSPVHVDEKEVIPSDQIESNSSSTKRNQHHLRQNNRNINTYMYILYIYSQFAKC